MRKLIWKILLPGAAILLLAACGTTPNTPAPILEVESTAVILPTAVPVTVVPKPDGLVYARIDGGRGELVAYDAADGREQFRLPAGLLSSDGSLYAALSE